MDYALCCNVVNLSFYNNDLSIEMWFAASEMWTIYLWNVNLYSYIATCGKGSWTAIVTCEMWITIVAIHKKLILVRCESLPFLKYD